MITTGAYFVHIAVDATTAVSLPTMPDGRPASRALLSVETAAARVRYDGGTPTAALGHSVAVGASMQIEGAQSVKQAKVIATSGTSDIMVTLETV